MLSLSTTPNHASLMNLAELLLEGRQSRVQQATVLAGMVPPKKSSWDTRLHLANMLLTSGEIGQAKEIVGGLDPVEYFQQATSAGQLNLLFSVLIRSDRGDEALFLLESVNMAERFGVLGEVNIRLRVADELLAKKIIDPINKLIAGLDPAKVMKYVNSADQVRLLFNVIAYFQRPSEIFRLLEGEKTIQMFSGESLVDLKLKVVNTLIMQGRREEARNLLSSMDPETLMSPTSGGLLAHSYTQLGMFDAADDCFAIAENKGLISDEFYIFKGVLHYCLRQMGSAEKCINKNIEQHGKHPPSLFWKSHLLNFNGRHQEALTWLDNLPNSSSLAVPVHMVFIYVEKGNTLRSLGRLDESLEFYKKAEIIELSHKATFWAWIACFEHAITLFYLGEHARALQIAEQGSRLDSRTYSNSYNPCTILWQFLLHRQKITKEPPTDPAEWARYAKLWPFPYFHHKMWMLLLAAIVLSDQKGAKGSEVIINDMVDDQTIVALNHKDFINGILGNSESWKNQGVLNALSAAIWPNHAEKAFERMMVKRLVCRQ